LTDLDAAGSIEIIMKKIIAAAFVINILIIIGSCQKAEIESLEKNILFTLSIGKSENELPLFHKPGDNIPSVNVAMANGLIFVSSSQGGKIMKFNSYGDILGLFYNPETNPKPVLLSTNLRKEEISTRRAFPYHFREAVNIAVSSELTLLVQDEIAEERQEFDDELNAMLDQIVLRFGKDGDFIDYLGQEGSGGTPFPYIERLQVSARGDPVIITRTQKNWIVFWYNEYGYLRYKLKVDLNVLPKIENENAIPSIGTIFADRRESLLYLKIDYYASQAEEFADNPSGIQYVGGFIHIFDLEQEKFIGQVEIPKHYRSQTSMDVLSFEKEQMQYEFIGVSDGGYLFFLAPSEGNYYELMILAVDGKVIKRVNVTLVDAETILRDFYVSPEGIVTALICNDSNAEVVWWRTDKYIEWEND
jgi:hypothetical protein